MNILRIGFIGILFSAFILGYTSVSVYAGERAPGGTIKIKDTYSQIDYVDADSVKFGSGGYGTFSFISYYKQPSKDQNYTTCKYRFEVLCGTKGNPKLKLKDMTYYDKANKVVKVKQGDKTREWLSFTWYKYTGNAAHSVCMMKNTAK